uniref:Solute carrier family 25 member 51 (Trinotate prediction) n=1 Tax=Myxobolus squamalis TaxID=59785 RepID=A0A6B2GAG4_MYXSQ
MIRDIINRKVIPGKHEHAKNFCTGAALGCILSTLCFPINATRIFMQGELGVPFKGLTPSYAQLYQLRGSNIRRIYIGAGANALRSILSWGVINTTHEYLVKNKYFVNN